jgi:hypothetical protein
LKLSQAVSKAGPDGCKLDIQNARDILIGASTSYQQRHVALALRQLLEADIRHGRQSASDIRRQNAEKSDLTMAKVWARLTPPDSEVRKFMSRILHEEIDAMMQAIPFQDLTADCSLVAPKTSA